MNIVLVLVLVVIAIRAVGGYRKGLVNEIVSLLALVCGVFIFALIASIIGSYITKHLSDMLIGIVSLLILIIAIQISKLFISSLKFMTKIPVIRGINKLAGFAVGLAEGLIFVWVGFILFDKFNFGGYAQVMLQQIQDNPFLTYIYDNNYVKILMKL